jgi:predicted amidophosphoribosyltransferase
MLDSITMPVSLFQAFIEDGTCPLCLGSLKQSEVCPTCQADLGPALDAIETFPEPSGVPCS